MPSGQLQYAYGAFVPRASKCSEGRCEKAPGVDSGVGHVSWSGHWRATHAFICILTLGRAPRMNLCSSKAGTTSSETGRGWQARGTLHSGAGKRTDCGQSGDPRITRVDSETPGMSTQRCASSPRPPFPLWLNGETHPREHDEPCWTETRVGQTTIGSSIFRFLQGTYCREIVPSSGCRPPCGKPLRTPGETGRQRGREPDLAQGAECQPAGQRVCLSRRVHGGPKGSFPAVPGYTFSRDVSQAFKAPL